MKKLGFLAMSFAGFQSMGKFENKFIPYFSSKVL